MCATLQVPQCPLCVVLESRIGAIDVAHTKTDENEKTGSRILSLAKF